MVQAGQALSTSGPVHLNLLQPRGPKHRSSLEVSSTHAKHLALCPRACVGEDVDYGYFLLGVSLASITA